MLTSPHAKGGGRNFLHDTLRPSPLTPFSVRAAKRVVAGRGPRSAFLMNVSWD